MVNRPCPLSPGAPVVVIAPASPPRSLDQYRNGLARLRSVYDVRASWSAGTERGYLAAPDASRAEAFNAAVENPDIRGIFCVRGGYGSLRMLQRIDWTSAREHPTLLAGYSDITSLHLALYAKAGWTGLSGPVVTEWARADDQTISQFQTLAEGGTSTLQADLTPLVAGSATGSLLGGNLSVMTRLIGTSYAPAFEGCLLYIEDVAEAPYRVDRMLAHLDLAGIFESVSGVVLGDFSTGNRGVSGPSLSLEEVFTDYFGDRPYPVAKGLQYGHLLPRITLPVGVPARLKVDDNSGDLAMTTSAVAE